MVLNIVVVGYGRMGLIHANNIHRNPHTQLLGIAARDADKAAQLAAQFSGGGAATATATLTMTLDEALQRSDVDGIVLTTPTDAHKEQLLACFRAGKAVMCEKPIALDPRDISECYNAAAAAGVPLFCAFNRRFDPSIRKLKDSIAKGSLGPLHTLRLTSRDHPPPGVGVLGGSGSFFDDFSVHDIDLACWLVGEGEPERVYACGSSFLPHFADAGIDDTATLHLRFKSGANVIIENSRRSTYGYDVRVEVIGEKGMMSVGNRPQSLVTSATSGGIAGDVFDFSFPERFAEAYTAELAHFVTLLFNTFPRRRRREEAVADDALVAVTKEQCVHVMNVTKRAQACRLAQLSEHAPPTAITVTLQRLLRKPMPTPATKSSTSSPHVVVNFCLIGAGRMGLIHAQTIATSAKARLLYICDVVPESAERCKTLFNRSFDGSTPETVSMKENEDDFKLRVLDNPDVHAVIITTISSTHCDLILKCAGAGKHIFCEKPLALSEHDTIACAEAASKTNVHLYCALMRRWDADFKQIKEKAASGALGTLEQLRITARDGASHNSADYLKAAGSYVYDSVIHDIDASRWIFQEDPIEVQCSHSTFQATTFEGVVEAITLVMRFKSGATAAIDNHRRAVYGYDQRVELHGSKAMLQAENKPLTDVVTSSPLGIVQDCTVAGLDRYASAYRKEVLHFVELVSNLGDDGLKPAVTMYDCVINSRIADAAMESAKDGGRPVPVRGFL